MRKNPCKCMVANKEKVDSRDEVMVCQGENLGVIYNY